jgi:hypothetical protein
MIMMMGHRHLFLVILMRNSNEIHFDAIAPDCTQIAAVPSGAV